MTTGNQIPEGLVTQAPPDAPQPSDVIETPEAPPDYKALYEEAHTEREKLKNDLKAQRISRMKQDERDTAIAMIPGLLDEISALRKEQQALIKSRVVEDEDLGKEMGRIREESSQRGQARALQNQYESFKASFYNAINDADGNPLIATDSPELAEAYEAFNKGSVDARMPPEQRVSHWSAAVGMAHKAAISKARSTLKAAQEAAKEAEKTARKKALDEAGVLDLDTGPGAGGGSITPDNIDALYNQGKVSGETYAQFLKDGTIQRK